VPVTDEAQPGNFTKKDARALSRGETSRAFSLSRGAKGKMRAFLKYAYCALSSRRPFKGLPRVASRWVVPPLCAGSFRTGDKNFSPRADKLDAAGQGEEGCGGGSV